MVRAPIGPTVRERQRMKVLFAVLELCADGWPASVREIGTRVGYASTQTTYGYLQELEQLGIVAAHPRRRQGGYLPTKTGRLAAELAGWRPVPTP